MRKRYRVDRRHRQKTEETLPKRSQGKREKALTLNCKKIECMVSGKSKSTRCKIRQNQESKKNLYIILTDKAKYLSEIQDRIAFQNLQSI